MWLYNDIEFTEDMIGGHFGFIYEITNLTNSRKYVGKKLFTRAGTKLKADVKKLGEENFARKILYLCKTRSECSYRETKEIFIRDALLTTEYYNSWVSCKIHKAHVLNKL